MRRKPPDVCRRCWWHEGGACFNEDLGAIGKDPETGLRKGHEIQGGLLFRCDKARKHQPTRIERLMRNIPRRDQ